MRRRFADVYRELKPEIHRSSHNRWQQVPGMSPEDIELEMLMMLWIARKTWNPQRGHLKPYWWSIWCNHRRNLMRAALQEKRLYGKEELASEVPEYDFDVEVIPDPPVGCTPTEAAVWKLLAVGMRNQEVRELLEISKRKYDNTIHAWQTPAVRRYLAAVN